ncbi:hypothetical protein CkaCkLH20_10533 [Colletotrichum karsti]|uniref:Uncharacterized protein n=1 Tax=Colletotrichum karsti TaxID=1095194 RepID=A0A9P6HZA1_9PEZI|nr:uncharacterized protein CkaCkLH20_10533 [Colletotrichum karsti]KAF9871901.1 hypothetical protein CkaCkLH20_10533 [Colletotrichum karsti]
MDDIQIFSYTPRPKPKPKPLRATPEGKVGPASLSYDIFLNIVDFLVADAARWTSQSAVWKLDYNHAAATKLVIQEKVIAFTKPEKSPHQMDRYHDTLLPSQLNRQTRVMVGKVFPRIAMVDEHGNEMLLKAWINPANDFFILDNHSSSAQGMHLMQAIMLPTPQGDILTASIRRISISSGSALHKFDADAVKILATLPNLEEMSMCMGEFFPDFGQRIVHNGIRAIDPKTYVELAKWAQKHGAAFASVYGALKKRGIRFVAGILESTDPWLEILHTAKGIRIRHLMANCSCCKADKLY